MHLLLTFRLERYREIGIFNFSMLKLSVIGIIYLSTAGSAMAQNPAPMDASQASPDLPGTFQVHTPRSSYDFIHSVGINTHIDAGGTSYSDLDLVVTCLKQTGIRYVREDAFEGWIPFQVARYKALADAGVQIDLNLGYGDAVDLVPVMLQAAEALEKASPGALCSLEGYNEVDTKLHHLTFNGKTISVAAHDYEAAAQTQEHLYKAVHDDPTLNKLPVLPFTLAWFNRSVYVRDVSAFADFANVHAYAIFGTPPRRALSTQIAGTEQVTGKPIIMTETGYPTIYPGSPNLKNLVDEKVQENFLLDSLFDNFSDNVVRTYIYELLDRRANFKDTTDQAHYGIFRYDGDPKPAATAIHNLLKILDDGSSKADATSQSPIKYTLTSTIIDQDGHPWNNDIHSKNYDTLLEKRSGAYDIVIWSEPIIWDAATFTLIPRKGTDTVDVTFPQAWGNVNVYDPSLGETPIQSQKNSTKVSVNIVDHPIIIEVGP
jgi:hypothetical protein